MDEFFSEHGIGIYAGTNLAFVVVIALSWMLQGDTGVNIEYLILLFALCTAPLALLDGLNGRYVLLAIFMALFFQFFGTLDVVRVVLGAQKASIATGMTPAQWGILCGGTCTLLAYVAVVRLPRSGSQLSHLSDWPRLHVLVAGSGLWLLGAATVVYFQVFVMPEKTRASATHAFESMGPVLTFMVMLGNLLAPLGTLVVAYGYARYRTLLWFLLILVVLLGQFGIGFVTNIRQQIVLPTAIVVVALTLVRSRVPVAWIIGAVAAIAITFPVLTAYRATISGERGLSRKQAIENLDQVIDEVLAYRDRVARGSSAEGQQTLFERVWLEDNVELVFDHTGVDVPFQEGATLVAIPLAFVPRLIWPDKPDVAAGLLFNHEFIHGDADTNVSPSHLGELYWNFGWPGLIAGMSLIGLILGWVARTFNLSEHLSVTRVLVLLATVYYLCCRFEGGLSMAYISWMRSLAAIGILHALFARRFDATRVNEGSGREENDRATPKEMLPGAEPAIARFPNVMR